jgi:hypothetical protein
VHASKESRESTSTAVLASVLFGATAFYISEIVCSKISSDRGDAICFPPWRIHAGAFCIGTLVFVTILFLLQSLGKRSKRKALSAIPPWFPLIAASALATAVHMSLWIVLPEFVVFGTLGLFWMRRI